MRSSFIVAALLIGGAVTAAAPRRALQIADMARIIDLEEPAISPGGERVALVVITQGRRAYVNTLVLVDTRTGAIRRLLSGADVAVPRWSPDGSRLAYLARSGRNGVRQLFVRDRSGRSAALTSAAGDVIDMAWSPNGERIAYVAADPQPRATYFFAGDNDYTATSLTPSDHLWIVPAWGGRARRLTSGAWTIAPTDPGGIFSPQIAWTRDGSFITFTRVENTFTGDDERSTLWQVDVANAALHKLTAHAELELAPAYSPDGSRLAYWYPLRGDFNSENTLRVLAAHRDRDLAPAFDRNVAGSLWLPNGPSLLVCATDRTRTLAWRVDLGGRAHPLPLGALNIVCDPYSSSTFDSGIAGAVARDGSIAFVATDATHARELYYLPSGASRPRRLTHFNDFISRLAIGRMVELDWDGPDGFHEDGVMTYPPNFRTDGKYPIVLLIHGGPGLSSTCDFVSELWPLAQIIASHGYIVFQPNYRGSDNVGNAYMVAIVHNTVAGPGADIMSGLAALERLPNVDSSRIAVSGWSYGGELTSWLIGHYHTWRAAVSGAAVNSEFDEYDLSTSNVQDRYPLGTSPYTDDGQRIYRENSPITYFAQITTPTLIWGTTLDPVVPITQSYALYHALHEHHVPVRFAVFAASTHGPADALQTAALTRLWLGWLDAHMR
jgi:dipeptidyl aminopeptidase/acylaminoacyl peptidase